MLKAICSGFKETTEPAVCLGAGEAGCAMAVSFKYQLRMVEVSVSRYVGRCGLSPQLFRA